MSKHAVLLVPFRYHSRLWSNSSTIMEKLQMYFNDVTGRERIGFIDISDPNLYGTYLSEFS